MNLGEPPTERYARTGEFTPPGMTRLADSKSSSDRVMTPKPTGRRLAPSDPMVYRHPVDKAPARRTKAIIFTAASATLNGLVILGGVTHLHINGASCGGDGTGPWFVPFVILAVAALGTGAIATFFGFAATSASGRIARAVVPLAGIATTLLGFALLFDVLTPPVVNLIC